MPLCALGLEYRSYENHIALSTPPGMVGCRQMKSIPVWINQQHGSSISESESRLRPIPQSDDKIL